MGTQDRQPPAGAPDPQRGQGTLQALTDGIPAPDDRHRGTGRDRLSTEDVLDGILAVLGPERIGRAVVAWAILLEPCDLRDGERIARELGLDHAVDHTRQEPAATVWSGTYMGVDVQVQAALRSTAGSIQ